MLIQMDDKNVQGQNSTSKLYMSCVQGCGTVNFRYYRITLKYAKVR